MKSKSYKSVASLVRYTTSGRFQRLFKRLEKARAAKIAKYAKDPNHKHVRIKSGSVSQVWPKRRLVKQFYECKICGADMD